MRTEEVIFSSLLCDEDYSRAVIPHLKPEYFTDPVDRVVYETIDNFIQKYNSLPTKDAVLVSLSDRPGMSDLQYERSEALINKLSTERTNNRDWLLEQTEKFCQEKSVYNAILQSIEIIDGKSSFTKEAIPGLLTDAVSVSFDSSIGHDFTEDFDKRYEYYHKKDSHLSFGVDILDSVTKGGVQRKTLNVFMGGTGTGKTLFKCAIAANMLSQGLNVLYITNEMAEEKIAERIDANLLDVTIDKLHSLSREDYVARMKNLKARVKGKLVIKEYPTSSASAANFRHLMRELRIKKNFVPDVVFLDYINICASSRVKNAQANSFTIVKSICEEVRALAVETNTAWISSTQVNRAGYANSDIDITDVSDSIGLTYTVDLLFGISSNEALDKLNQMLVKQLKNRYDDKTKKTRFVIGVQRAKMKLFDVEASAQDILNEGDLEEEHFSRNKSKSDHQPRDKFKDFR